MAHTEKSDNFFLDDAFEETVATPRKKRSKLRKVLIGLGVLVCIGVLAVAGVLFAQYQKFESLKTFGDPFAELTDRPTKEPTQEGKAEPVNFLILGSDSRISAGDPEDWEPGAQRTDAILLLHISGDRRSIAMMSIPRDSWVDIEGVGKAKINAAFSYGGPSLTIQTVENLTGVKIDHFALVDFTSFTKLTDLVGGVDLTTAAGTEHMSGDEALDFVRERYSLPNGDFDRVRRQQAWMKAVFQSLLKPDVLSSPSKLMDIYGALQEYISVDSNLSVNELVDLGTSLRNISSDDVVFLTAPYAGTGRSEDGQSIVLLDNDQMAGLNEAFQQDRVKEWVVTHPELETLDSRPIE